MSFTPERLLQALESSLDAAREPAAQALCLALSGGLDSTVLLHALARLRVAGNLRLPLRAVHVDHGLHPGSADWSAACARLAAEVSVPLTRLRVNARAATGESPEAAARVARYGALQGQLGAGEVLLTAHHADDQLETILLQWLRGGGLQAVAGMARLARFGAGWHARPLLDTPREH
ncbi:MAG TPA: tRNA lysidine(34) synthetase TilS, partial [Steroidobacteraceae bacterium]